MTEQRILKENDIYDEEDYHPIQVFCCEEEMDVLTCEDYEYDHNEYYVELECKICGMKATLILEPKEEDDDEFDWTKPEFFQEGVG